MEQCGCSRWTRIGVHDEPEYAYTLKYNHYWIIRCFFLAKRLHVDLFEKLGLITIPNEQVEGLYHYTTQEGLLGILTNNQIWATDIEYLNDTTELCYALNQAKNELNERNQKAGSNKEKEKINCLLDEIDHHRFTNIAVSCLTEERDLLSQWRAYGGKGSGYSIGFNVPHFIELMNSNDYSLVKVDYDLDNQKRIISELIDHSLAEGFNTESTRYAGTSVAEDGTKTCTFLALAVGGDFIKNLYSIAPCFKDPSFYEEREWRLISRIPPKDICLRPNMSMLIPYTKLELGEKFNYLTSITIGPSLHMGLSIEALKKFMAKFSYINGVFDSSINQMNQKIQILESTIPFRNW